MHRFLYVCRIKLSKKDKHVIFFGFPGGAPIIYRIVWYQNNQYENISLNRKYRPPSTISFPPRKKEHQHQLPRPTTKPTPEQWSFPKSVISCQKIPKHFVDFFLWGGGFTMLHTCLLLIFTSKIRGFMIQCDGCAHMFHSFSISLGFFETNQPNHQL